MQLIYSIYRFYVYCIDFIHMLLYIMGMEKLISISEASEIMGVSIDTLRRWDESGKFVADSKSDGGHRLYSEKRVRLYAEDLFSLAFEWASASQEDVPELNSALYCEFSATFQSRLLKMDTLLGQSTDQEVQKILPLVVAVAGEIGNNSFDHNLGQWPDVPGIFFGYNLPKRQIILADRGQGILKTLRRVRPSIGNDSEALVVAFTEVITGREPEKRGNGLKFVRSVVTKNFVGLSFQTGLAELELKRNDTSLSIRESENDIQGSLVLITY